MSFYRNRRAKGLRQQTTDAEARLWYVLRRKHMLGFKFRRQHPIGRYVADFACPEARLVIEVDGGQHAEQVARDAARTRELEAHGYTVLRFWNNEVLANFDGVQEVIRAALGARR
ncbi:MAG: endonuclease domain-containing protein [Rhodovibrio sp.]|nr:endonuclease domain-containing protein [Rhodovibrio sp.]